MSFQENLKTIQEAYEGIISEGVEPKFKVGDKVGIGSFGSYEYQPHDTGHVNKINKFGHHTVEFDKRKNSDDGVTPYHEQFDARGKSRAQYSGKEIIPLEQHQGLVDKQNGERERTGDIHKIIEHINGKRNGLGHYSKFDPAMAEHIKGLIDKHTEANKE